MNIAPWISLIVAVAIFALRSDFSSETPARIAATGPAAALPTELPASLRRASVFDTRTAPLLYATPEVEVLYDDVRRDRSGPATLKASATAESEPESRNGRREYHF